MERSRTNKGIIEKLWNGELYATELCKPQDENYENEIKRLETVHRKLLALFEEDKRNSELLEEYEEHLTGLAEMENKEAFKCGFSIAVNMILEALVSCIIHI